MFTVPVNIWGHVWASFDRTYRTELVPGHAADRTPPSLYNLTLSTAHSVFTGACQQPGPCVGLI
jgi:hypothetical protein